MPKVTLPPRGKSTKIKLLSFQSNFIHYLKKKKEKKKEQILTK